MNTLLEIAGKILSGTVICVLVSITAVALIATIPFQIINIIAQQEDKPCRE
jgi:hypothetical protein